MFKFASLLLNAAVSNTVKQEIIKRYGSKPNFPKDDLDPVLNQLETLVPAGNKAKIYILWLAKQLWGMTPPGFVLGEDDAAVKPLIHDFDEDVTKNVIKGKEADINNYEDLEALRNVVEGDTKEVEGKGYTEEQKATIKAGSDLVYNADGWVVYRVNKSSDKNAFAAAQLLCDNSIHSVSWCVGRGTTHYITQGNFYVLEKNGRSKYAISTDERSATIWNPADTPVWSTSGSGGTFHSIEKQAEKMGIDAGDVLDKMSALPRDIIGILSAVTKEDNYLAKRIPSEQLVEGDTKGLDKVIYATPLSGLVDDLNKNFSSSRTVGSAAAVMSRAIALKIDFATEYDSFKETTMIGYIELLAAAGFKTLPKSLEDYFVTQLEK
jgi:hypothetical protein